MLREAGFLTQYAAIPMVMDQWELRNIFDSEFSDITGKSPTRCKDIRSEHEAFWSTGEWGPPNYIPPNPPISPEKKEKFSEFYPTRTQIYSCVLPGEIVRECMHKITSGLLNPVDLLQIKHLIVDEFQDLNPIDLDFVYQLIDRECRTFVAGDDDQSIYSFRFASPEGIQRFDKKYPSCSAHKLSDCFRCTPEIVKTAESLINAHRMPEQIPKSLNSLYVSSNPPLEGKVHTWRFASGIAEAKAIARSCQSLIQAGMPPREILILINDRKVLETTLTGALDEVEVSYESPSSDGYVNSEEGRFLLSCLRIICNRNDYVAYRSILGLLNNVGPGICNDIAVKILENNLNFKDLFYKSLPSGVFGARDRNAIGRINNIVKHLVRWNPKDTLSQRSSDIANLIQQLFGNSAVENFIAATSHLPKAISIEELRDYLWTDNDEQQRGVLDQAYQRLGEDIPEQLLPERIRIMTMHGSKGLDARVVFVPGLEDKLFPGRWRNSYPGLVLEAARLLYMSITRARAACIISYANTRIVYGKYQGHTPSRFAQSLGKRFEMRNDSGLTEEEVQVIIDDCNHL